MGEGECELAQEEQPKKSRHRKKHLYNTILKQMEFYFSDSNLSKDRFLSNLLAVNSCVNVEVFLQFNKIRKLNCSEEDIKKAIKKSALIELSEDGTKIFRKKPFVVKDNEDFCTLYVENIKAEATHESLSQIFSDFGNVVYVSIPKYKHNRANKGFAFIEYETEEEANQALAFFESIGCRIPSEKNPEDLQSIVTFEDKNDEDDKGSGQTEPLNSNKEKRKLSADQSVDNKIPTTGNEELQTVQDSQKDAQTVETEEEGSKKRKLNAEEENTDSKKLKTDEAVCAQVEEHDEINGKKKKKTKKEKRKNLIKELGMQVLPKKEWKKLRNRYLQLQRKKMKEFKEYLNKQKFSGKSYDKKKNLQEEKDNLDGEKMEENISDKVQKLSYIPGVIVKLKLPEPCIDVKKLKNEIKSITPEIMFVDIPLPAGSEEVYVRFGSSESAKDFCSKDCIGQKILLTDEEEKNYWQKIETDRTVKFQKLAKKQRGREKLLKKAEKESAKHLRFEENE